MQAPSEFHPLALGYSMAPMKTIDEIRHENLERLIERAGSIQAVADKLEKAHAQISQLKNRNKHSGSRKSRAIGDDMARLIEAKFELGRGWMDNPMSPFPDEPPNEAEAPLVVADILSKSNQAGRRMLAAVTREVLDQNRAHFTGEEMARYDATLGALAKDSPGESPKPK